MAVGKQRGKGEGSIYYEQATGRWRGAVVLPDGSRRRVSGKNAKAVRDQVRAIQREVERGVPLGRAQLTVGQFLDEWLTNVAPGRARVRSPNTLDGYRWVIGRYLTPGLGSKRLAALTVDDVEAVLRSMARKGMSRSSVVRARAVLVLALTHAERRDLVFRNVARLSEIPAGCAEPKEGRSLTVEQARLVLRAAEGDRYEALYLCGLTLGLRPGELCGLMWEDVDLEAATVQIRRSLKNERAGLRIGEPKTRRSYRGLDLPPAVVSALRVHRVRQAQERLFAGRAWVDHGLVFTSQVGTPVDPANLRRSFSTLTTSVGLGHWTPKELRHSAASLLSAAGVPLELIADVLGHDGTRMTATVYRHAVRPTVSAGAEAMQRIFPA